MTPARPELTPREWDLAEALAHALHALASPGPSHIAIRQDAATWIQYHVARATQSMPQKIADELHEGLAQAECAKSQKTTKRTGTPTPNTDNAWATLHSVFTPDARDVRNSFIELEGVLRRLATATNDRAQVIGPQQAISESAPDLLAAYRRHATHTIETIRALRRRIGDTKTQERYNNDSPARTPAAVVSPVSSSSRPSNLQDLH